LFDSEEALRTALPARLVKLLKFEPAFVHVLTHKDLHLHPVVLKLSASVTLGEGAWYSAQQWPQKGLPAPVRQLLERMTR
jgi:A/G-specific adenine glycosylase